MTFDLAVPGELIRDAVISDDRQYRYLLGRLWDPGAERLGFVMLNPSTADAEKDDATIRRCMGFARREGFGGIVVANLFAYRATDPADLIRAERQGIDIIGPENDATLAVMAGRTVIAGWGSRLGERAWHYARVDAVARVLERSTVLALGTTRDGFPRHPLYVRGDAPLETYGSTS